MGTFGGIDACDAYRYLESNCQGRAHPRAHLDRTHRLVLQIHLLLGNVATPTPASQSSTGSVEHVEVVAIADARDLAKDATLPEGTGLDIARPRDAAQIRAVDM